MIEVDIMVRSMGPISEVDMVIEIWFTFLFIYKQACVHMIRYVMCAQSYTNELRQANHPNNFRFVVI